MFVDRSAVRLITVNFIIISPKVHHYDTNEICLTMKCDISITMLRSKLVL